MYFSFLVSMVEQSVSMQASKRRGRGLEEGSVAEMRFRPGLEKPRDHPRWERKHLHPVELKRNRLQANI